MVMRGSAKGRLVEEPLQVWFLSWSMVVCLLILPSPLQAHPVRAGFSTGYGGFFNTTGPSLYGDGTAYTYIVVSPNNVTALALKWAISNTSGPFCYLESMSYEPSSSDTSPNVTIPSNYSVTPWTAPCPRLPLATGMCAFAFLKDGDMRLTNLVAGKDVLVWSSNTTGLNATILDVLDFDVNGGGNIVLYNAKNETVWENVRDHSYTSEFQCGFPSLPASRSGASNDRLSVSYATLILGFLGSAVLIIMS